MEDASKVFTQGHIQKKRSVIERQIVNFVYPLSPREETPTENEFDEWVQDCIHRHFGPYLNAGVEIVDAAIKRLYKREDVDYWPAVSIKSGTNPRPDLPGQLSKIGVVNQNDEIFGTGVPVFDPCAFNRCELEERRHFS